MKYLLVKAWLGFGDRLQGLKMCVKYAQESGRAILIDWSDSIWSHSEETFYTYFDLRMPTFKIQDLDPELSVYPEYWKGKLDKTLTIEMLNAGIDIGDLQKLYNEDIVVYCCAGYRLIFNDSKFFTKVFKVIHPEILRRVHQRRQQYQLSTKIGIHLRGTDRATEINKLNRFRGIKLRMTGLGLLAGQEFIAVSDDQDFTKMWKSNFKFPLLTELIPGGSQGNHQISRDSLTISKNDLNIDMLVDFFTLASCKGILSTSNDSRFAQEAERLHFGITDMI
jgi:hypothetical protein